MLPKLGIVNKRMIQKPIYLARQLLKYARRQEVLLTNNVSDFLAWEKMPEKLRSYFPI